MLSRRLPHDLEPNAWARLLEERRAAGARLLGLSETNPTRVGLGGAGSEELAALAQAGGARYEPDPRGSLAAREAVAGYYDERGASVPPGSGCSPTRAGCSWCPRRPTRSSSRSPRSRA